LGDKGNRAAIYIYDSSNNVIGGTEPGAGNLIAFNTGDGVYITQRNQATGNSILGNSIYSNSLKGINLGKSANDPGDWDEGPNHQQNSPVMTSVSTLSGSSTIQGALNSKAGKSYRLEFFSNTDPDPSGYGEGETFLGSTSVTTDSSGNASLSASFSASAGTFVTATATDDEGNTSEFSRVLLPLEMNTLGDEQDANPNDGAADVDLGTPGPQTTLRAAIEFANANRGTDTITFNIPGVTGVPTISPASPLPPITESVVIDASTQPVSGRVKIDGTTAGTTSSGLDVSFGTTNVQRLTIANFSEHGILTRASGAIEAVSVEILTDGGWGIRALAGDIRLNVSESGAAPVNDEVSCIVGNGTGLFHLIVTDDYVDNPNEDTVADYPGGGVYAENGQVYASLIEVTDNDNAGIVARARNGFKSFPKLKIPAVFGHLSSGR